MAHVMRISNCSSAVCASDLAPAGDLVRMQTGNRFAAQEQLAAYSSKLAAHGADECRFARAVGADQGSSLACGQLQIDIGQGLELAETLGDAASFEQGSGGGRGPGGIQDRKSTRLNSSH